jgi:hypothetical protein
MSMKTIRTAGAASIAAAFALFASLLGASCSDALLDEMGKLAAEANRPAISPSAASIITAHETITLSFDSDMAVGAVSVGGNIGLAAPASAWADPRTLNLNPANGVAWSAGAGKKLTVSISESGQTTVYEYTFEVFNGVCVEGGDPAASDDDSESWAGTQRHPISTIAKAIAIIQTIYPTGSEVRVAPASLATTPVNEYQVDYNGDAASRIVLAEGYSLRGGYSRDWNGRSIGGNPTVIRDMSGIGGAFSTPNRAVDCGSGLSLATELDGFTVIGSSSGANSVAILCEDSSPTIKDCAVLAGGTTAAGTERKGIFATGSASPVIRDCSINASASAGGSSTDYCVGIDIYEQAAPTITGSIIAAGKAKTGSPGASYAIRSFFSDSTPVIDGNEIRGGEGYDTYSVYINTTSLSTTATIQNNAITSGTPINVSYAIALDNAQATIRNNTIIVGRSSLFISNTYGIYLYAGTSATYIENNALILVQQYSGTWGIFEDTTCTAPQLVDNNLFWGFTTDSTSPLYRTKASVSYGTAATLNSGLAYASGNIDIDPHLDASYRPTASSPSAFTTGGKDGAVPWGFTKDKDGAGRTGNGTTGWTIGCFEFD